MSPSSLSSCLLSLPSLFSSFYSSSSSSSTSTASSIFTTTSFTQTASSHLTFSSFPPTTVPKHSLNDISLQVAIALLHDHRTYISTLCSPTVTAYHEIPQQASREAGKFDQLKLPAESFSNPTAASLEKSSSITSTRWQSTKLSSNSEWKYYSVTDTLPLPVRLIKSETTYQVALRPIEDGIESLVFAQGYFMLHNTLRIESRGSCPDEETATETLWLVEAAEVRCCGALAWYIEKSMAASRKLLHERFRVAWEGRALEALEKERSKIRLREVTSA
jgi:hypothetical protein